MRGRIVGTSRDRGLRRLDRHAAVAMAVAAGAVGVRMVISTRRLTHELELHVAQRTADLEASRDELLRRLARAAEFRDDETAQHTERVGLLAHDLGGLLGVPEEPLELLRLAAPLHDVGKIGVADSVLYKRGPLDPEEWIAMQWHTHIGAQLLADSSSPVLQVGEEIALSHHERWDGSGYPFGLSGEEIPRCGRIVAVADVFDALTHDRPYKAAWSEEEAEAHIVGQSGSQFDPTVVEAFRELRAKRFSRQSSRVPR